MNFRTDLALEMTEQEEMLPRGVSKDEIVLNDARVTRITVLDEKGEQAIGKPRGNYITVEVPPFSDSADEMGEKLDVLARELRALLPAEGMVFVAGLGNSDITPDALGPKTANKILATRHIAGEVARSAGLSDLRSVAVFAPGVLGQTGIETAEMILSVVARIKPAAVIVIDALASRNLDRLGCTVQISDTGISPGSGVGNRRFEISQNTLGVPVIAVGVPTVVDGATLAMDLMGGAVDEETLRSKVEPRGAQMVVTPKEIDLLIDRAAALVALSINTALQPSMSPEDILSLVS